MSPFERRCSLCGLLLPCHIQAAELEAYCDKPRHWNEQGADLDACARGLMRLIQAVLPLTPEERAADAAARRLLRWLEDGSKEYRWECTSPESTSTDDRGCGNSLAGQDLVHLPHKGEPMFARLTTVQSTPERLPELKHQLQSRVLPTLRLQPGFRRLLVLGNSESKLVTLTLWETEADEQATFGREYLHNVLDEATLTLLKNSRSDSYEVLFSSDGH